MHLMKTHVMFAEFSNISGPLYALNKISNCCTLKGRFCTNFNCQILWTHHYSQH